MTNHWIDIKNSDAILIMGSNAAEHHPIAFKWIMKAKDRGAVLMHVDPKFSRTSARCDFHVPLRSGTDIAFLGGMIRYIIESGSWFRDNVLNYTNASHIIDEGFRFQDGLFTGYDPEIPLYYWVDRYELLRHQLGYNYQEYSFYWLDPLCDVEAPAEHAGKYGKEVYGL